MNTKPRSEVKVGDEPPAYDQIELISYKKGTPRTSRGERLVHQNWLLHPQSTSRRFIIDFYPQTWCGPPNVLAQRIRLAVPPILAERGITIEEWKECTDSLLTIVKGTSVSTCASFWCCMSCVFIPVLYYFHHSRNSLVT
jgi:hypothetical protein